MGMLQIGTVAFETTGPHFDKLKHTAKGDWARQKRFGRKDAMQWTGEGEENVTVSGTIYTDYYPGFDALGALRGMRSRRQMVVSGAGDVFGEWCILDVTNEQTLQDRDGVPRKVTFDVHLTAYGEDGFSGLGLVGGAIGAMVSGSLGASLGGITASIGGGLGGVTAAINGNLGSLAATLGASLGVSVGASIGLAGASASISPSGLNGGVDVGARLGPLSASVRLF